MIEKGLNKNTIIQISNSKSEPSWMLNYRLKAYDHYIKRPVPEWGVDLQDLKEEEIVFYTPPGTEKTRSWDEVPVEMKDTFDKLKIPEAEREFLAGVETQFDSNVIYGRMKKQWEELGVIFTNMEDGVKNYPEIVKRWFGKVIPYNNNKYSALNSACWSGGSFVYVPPGVKVDFPLQAFFYIQNKNLGQFERTLIIADEGAEVHYVEGCTAPTYTSSVLHSGVIELVALKNAKIRYTTIQNWSTNIYNLVTQRGLAHEGATIEWVDCNLGSKCTMKYPSVMLVGRKAHGEVLSIAVAKKGQWQDTGAKMYHLAPETSSVINTKSICQDGGRTSYRGLVKIPRGQRNARSKVVCDALILDNRSQTDTYPYNEIDEYSATIEHEASVSKVSEEQTEYLMSRGLSEEEASGLIVSGFIEPISKELPMEYAMELNELIRLSMEGSVG